MRRALLPLLVLLLAAPPPAAAQHAHVATLTIEVGADHAETMRLTLEGLDRLTRYQGICLPQGAKESRVHDDVGDVEYTTSTDENGRRSLSFTARGATLHVDMARGAPSSAEHPLYSADVNFCVPNDTFVRVNVEVPEDHTLFFLTDGGEIQDGRVGSTTSDGPTHVFYSYEAPVGDADLRVFDEGTFRAFVRPDLEQAARVVVGQAADPYAAALAEAGLDLPFDALRVRFVRETPFDWEAGHYNGQGYVTVKESALEAQPSEGFPYGAVKVVVHEAFHAASFPYGKGEVEDDLAWWLEGSARRSERHVDAAMPNATILCERAMTEVRCASFDDRISRADLEIGYDPSFTFDPDWAPSLPQDEDTRRFYYGYSEFVVGAWIAQHGVPAYRAVWDDVEAAFERGEGCPCREGWLEGLLDEETLFRPWAPLRTSDPAAFELRVEPFVKDEQALEDALAERSNPLAGLGVPLAPWLALAGLAVAVALRRGRE